MDAQITFFVDTSAASAIELTDWGVDENANKLYKGTVPTGLTNSDVRLTEVTASISSYTLQLPVKAYLTDTSSNEEKAQQDHNASWAAALNASNDIRKVTFTYSSSEVSGKLNTNEVYFYTTTAEAAYAKGSEGISGASEKTQQLSKAIADLTDGTYANTAVGQANAVIIGYLHVRFDGSQRLHSGSYGATIAAEAGTGAAQANA